MLSNIFSHSSIGALEQVAAFAEARHGLLAGNIANLDTPGYKTRDLSLENFQEKLKGVIAAQHHAQSPSELTSPGAVAYDESDPMREVRESMKSILYHDQSDVGLEQQVTELANNQMLHNMAIALMSSQFRQLQTAISERV
jgi:flagellar basal-body rod protein FlgB